ncbi:MAG: alpha-mannosidase, partial [Clostridia bacterium]|nr:alpha-mannosidase [Clostridia bacterium]
TELGICTNFDRFGVSTNPQFLLYVNGKIRQGMDTRHREYLLPEGTHFDIYIYAYTGPSIPACQFNAEIRNVNLIARDFYYDINTPHEAIQLIDENTQEYMEILTLIDRALSMLDLYDVGSAEYFESMKAAKDFFDKEFYEKYCQKQRATVACIGHTHIDCAWLWTLRQTREKAQRSFATVLELMRRFPEYKFTSSQPLLYKFVKEEAPELYAEIKERVAEGRWECEGGMWVEADCNLPNGESFIRQFIYGKRFFREEFGKDNRVLWLPDVFGYSAALPQILKSCGIDWFVTSKISWNDTNTVPCDTFKWQGIDGTSVNAYFLTAQDKHKDNHIPRGVNYNGTTEPKQVAGTYARYHQKNISDEVILTYGYGDGGGGPTAEQIEVGKRLTHGVPGIPNTRFEHVGPFLSRLEKKIENNPALPKWIGELYLEYHRGTYTSIAKNKKNNRKSEFLYMNAEWLSEMAKHLLGESVPKQALREGWETILTNQFHDIIPGSSIGPVYDQSDVDYAKIMFSARNIIADAQEEIASKISAERGFVVFNPNSFAASGKVLAGGKTGFISGIPAKGYVATNDIKFTNSVSIEGNVAETPLLRVEFDESWQIKSLYDKKAEREVMRGAGNELRVYADYPDTYDNWEWQEYSLSAYKTLTAVSEVEIVEDGARKGVKVTRPFMHSTVTQTMWFCDETPTIDFETHIDWHEHNKMLKTAFDVDINAEKATYEIQFGSVERPTHKNTSWDRAKFEVCAHKYADLSDGGYGVSLLNDCKYGHDIHEGVMMLSLLKSGVMPYPEADQGEHEFTYSIYVHEGTLRESDTVNLAYLLNNPPVAVRAKGKRTELPESYSFVSVDKNNVICETVKEAEDGTETVLRLYESKNTRTKTQITLGFPAKKCFVCDMLENEKEELPITDGKVSVTLHGFEILTLKFE